MNSNANDRYGPSLERTLGAGKPVDPATRLSELLAQSLEELTRPFDPPRPGQNPAAPEAGEPAAQPAAAAAVTEEGAPEAPAAEPVPESSRMEDRALAELEAELFAAAKQVDSETVAAEAQGANEKIAAHAEEFTDDLRMSLDSHDAPEAVAEKAPAAPFITPPTAPVAAEETPVIEGDAARVIAKVRRLMLVSMAVTIVAVGSVFGFVGYRIYKNEGRTEKQQARAQAHDSGGEMLRMKVFNASEAPRTSPARF